MRRPAPRGPQTRGGGGRDGRAHHEEEMTLEELRSQIDVLDRQLVDLLSARARVVLEIGRVKAANALPVHEMAREQKVLANVHSANQGPLPDSELTHIFERILDVMRALQRNELASQSKAPGA